MALIDCPECGKKVSSSAKNCPDCGYPIADKNPVGEVRIKINLDQYLLSVIIYEEKTMKELWKGKTGSVAVLNVTEPTGIIIKGRCGKTSSIVKAGKKYEFRAENGFFIGKEVLNKIDLIDSD